MLVHSHSSHLQLIMKITPIVMLQRLVLFLFTIVQIVPLVLSSFSFSRILNHQSDLSLALSLSFSVWCANKMSKSATVCSETKYWEILLVCMQYNKHHAVWFEDRKQCEMQCRRYVSGWLYRFARIPYITHIEQTHQSDIGWFKATIVSFHAVSQLSDIALKRRSWDIAAFCSHYPIGFRRIG